MTRKLLPLLPLVLGLAFLLPQPSTAQNENGSPAVDEDSDPRGPLPFYYGKLGLDEDQKQQLYTIQDQYDVKIEAIEKQLAQLKNEQDAKMQMLLTPGQKLRLRELREAAERKKTEELAKTAEDPTSADGQ